MISDEILKEIFEDMNKCDEVQGDNKKAEVLHDQLIAKYKIVFHDFEDTTQKRGKRSFDPEFDYCEELLNVKERLDGYILRDSDSKGRLLKKRILSDIHKLASLNTLEREELIDLYDQLTGYYDSVISDLGNGLYGYVKGSKFYESELDEKSLIFNIKKIKNKIEAFYDRGCE